MIGWAYILIAVGANVSANILLKKSLSALADYSGPALIKHAIAMPAFWGFGASAAALLACYALALKTLDLSVAYASVTSLALIGVTIAAYFLLGESITVLKILGIALIAAGIVLATLG